MRVLYSPGWSQLHSVAKYDLELLILLLFPQVLDQELQVCATKFAFHILFLFVYFAYVPGDNAHMYHRVELRGQLSGVELFFHILHSQNQTHIFRLDSKCQYLLSNLTGPLICSFK